MLRKHASMEVLDAWRVPGSNTPRSLRKAAHRVEFEYTPRPGYLYVRSRAISSRTNDNHDTFPAAEIEKAYKTFLGKPAFVNHHNANHRRARGVIIAAAIHHDRAPDGSPDTWVELLHEIDAVRFPRLAKAILAGRVNRTSMGVDCEYSTCSACGNKATSPAEYCQHMPGKKGMRIRQRGADGKVREQLIHEICAGLTFFENSFLVEDPADPTAFILGQPDTRGLNISPRTAMLRTGADDGDTSYRMSHQGPDADEGEGLHEIGSGKIWPKDFHERPREYSLGAEDESVDKVHGSRGWPSRKVMVYRAVPSPHRNINTGDWVSTSSRYARGEGRTTSNSDDDYPVLKFQARADQLRNEGNSLDEWSYHGPPLNRAEIHFSGGKNHRGKSGRGKTDSYCVEHEPDEMFRDYEQQTRDHRQRKKEEREARKAQWGQHQGAAGHEFFEQPLYHGTRSILHPGDHLTVEQAEEHPNNPDLQNASYVHATTDAAEAHRWGWRADSGHAQERAFELGRDGHERAGHGDDSNYRPRVYRVHPTGPVEPDTEYDDTEHDSYRSAHPMRVGEEVRPLSCYHPDHENEEHWPGHPHYDFLKAEQDDDDDDWGEHEGKRMRPRTAAWSGQQAADADNLYQLTGCHHAACGRSLSRRRTANGPDIIEQRLHDPSDPAVAPVRPIAEGARSYASKVGLPDPHTDGGEYSHIETNPDRIKRLARAYHSLPMDDPGAHAAFADMARQVHHQYDHLTNTMGVHVEVVHHDPYANHLEMAHDLAHNRHLAVLGTAATGPHGFFDDDTNDKFRAVHDAFGHAATGRSFDRHGEEAAWLAHSRMFHGIGRHAMTTETRGQNSMLIATGNFPPQKTALLPHEFMQREAARYENAEDHPWFQTHPGGVHNLIHGWEDTSDDEKAQGERWYPDAHLIAKGIAGGDAATGAGLLAAYSPRTNWPANLHNAARSFHEGRALGPGDGAIMGMHQRPAARILAGEHHSAVFKSPKVSAFAHLIEHGGQQGPEERVVVDRHALSAWMGRRVNDDDLDKTPISTPKFYKHVEDHFIDAAHHVGVTPEHMQAGLWLRQVRRNAEEDKMMRGAGGTGRVRSQRKDSERWEDFRQQHHPDLPGVDEMHHSAVLLRTAADPPVRVPPSVDTLRPSQCPVCGDQDVYKGQRCPICGFVAPPDIFRDPNIDQAQLNRQMLEDGKVESPMPEGPADEEQIGSGMDAEQQMMHPDQIAPDGVPGVQQGGTLPGQGMLPGEDGEEGLADPSQMDGDGRVTLDENGQPLNGGEELQDPGALGPDGQPLDPGAEGDPEAGGEPGEEDPAELDDASLEEEEQGEADEEQGEQDIAEGEQELAQAGQAPMTQGSDQGDGGTGAALAAGAVNDAPEDEAPEDEADEDDASPGKDQDEDRSGGKKKMAKRTAAQAVDTAQQRAMGELRAENLKLRRECSVMGAQLRFVAELAGIGPELDAIRRHADLANPASPVPDPPEAPAPESTEQALAPLTQDDVSRPGTTPGANQGVPAQQTTTAITPGVEMQTAPAGQLIDVTAPIQGTNPSQDGGVPIQQRRIETDVRIDPDPLKAQGPGIGGAGNDGTAFPWVMDARQTQGGGAPGGQQKAAARQPVTPGDERGARTFAAIRLAKLRVTAGVARGDELDLAMGIEHDAALTLRDIEREITTLDGVARAHAAAAQPRYPRNMVPRTAMRAAPSFASSPAPMMAMASTAVQGDDDFDVFID